VQGKLAMIDIEQKSWEIFPTLVMTFDLSKLPIKDRIIEVMTSWGTNTHRLAIGGESSYNEKNPQQFLDHPDLALLKNTMQQCVNTYANQLGLKPVRITNSWFNKLGKGGSVGLHRHEMSAISGAYYPLVDVGSTPLLLRSPKAQVHMYDFALEDNRYNTQEQEVACVQDMLVLFPSWIEHYSHVNNTETRYTVSFNTSY
jgi:uncharacterized protein (TIGR02466 family)